MQTAEQTTGRAAEEEPVFIKQELAARRAGVSLRQFQRWAAEGRVTVYRPSRRLSLVEWKAVERMVRATGQVAGENRQS